MHKMIGSIIVGVCISGMFARVLEIGSQFPLYILGGMLCGGLYLLSLNE